ncbi:PAS domain S-box-containing protein [Marinomonas polaris DSM 16579]|uniref:Sensory/regulatory protein RpfC n=1 Tax=Marinomonas polaris DSM 16579 TaxID=1122206 RepID=A0A1M5A8S9_9GAMM|nr:PAS domain S-box protein [Marinomonas polaris]SHF26555.1 PAS domain S-box-containing protein [Marinomonas polaris DSM 16579]
MNQLEAALKVARSLLGMSCAGLLFQDGTIVFSGEVDSLHQKNFSVKLSRFNTFPSSRYSDIKNTPSAHVLFSDFSDIASCIIEPLSINDTRLIFLSDTPFLLNAESLEEHIDSLKRVFSALLESKKNVSKSFLKDRSFANKNTHQVSYDDLLKLNNSIPMFVALVDNDLRYEFVNDTFEHRFSMSKEHIIGLKINELIPPEVFNLIHENLDRALQGTVVNFQYEVLQNNSDELRFFESTYVPRIQEGEVTGLYICMQDITRQRLTLHTMKRLHEVTADANLSLDQKLQRILKIGVDQFSLPIGLISSINGDLYQVEYSHTPNGEVLPGAQFELGNTYCVHTLSSDLPTSYFHTAISDIKEHPCYQNFGLEAYIGIVINVAGKRWGTLNFSSPNPKNESFSEEDYELMKLLAQWVGNEMTRFHDKAMQTQYENELREQKIFFKSLFDNAPEAIVHVGANREIKMLNPAFTELFGYSLDELYGKTTQVLYAEESEFIRKGELYNVDMQDVLNRYLVSYKSKQGKVFHAETIGSIIRNADDSLGGYIAHIRDVTERLEVEQKMIDTNLRLSIAADAAGIGVWEFDLQDSTLQWDDWMYRLYGFAEDERTSPLQVWDDCVYTEDKNRLAEVFSSLEKSGAYFTTKEDASHISKELDFDFRIKRKDGQVRYLKSNGAIVFNKKGKASHLIGVNMDITSRKETEVLLRNASDQAVAASKAKSDFLATMSHEIRTPLNGVLGMAELLSGTKLNPEQTTQLNVLKESGEGLLGLINDLLDFSKIEAGHISIERVDFNLEKAIYDVIRLLMMKADEKGIDLLVEYDEVCPRFLVGDVFRIKQILTNLISNAIKFTSIGHVLVSVKGIVDKQGMVSITMSVADTGVGIADKVQPHLFSAFVQADSSTTRKFGGTGLGLAITKQLIGLMNGNISLSSKLNIGSTFTVTFALPESHAMSYIETVVDENLLLGKKTLVIDDNETNLTILKNQLRSCDIYADAEISPVDALSRIEQSINDGSPYQIIVLDYLMPELDGLMLSKLIREVSGSLYQPIILMTSSAGRLSQGELSTAGVNMSIVKPMSALALKKGLVSALSSNLLGHQLSYVEVNDEDEVKDNLNGEKKGLILVVEDMKANLAVAQGILTRMGFDVIAAENGKVGIEMWTSHQPDLIFMDLHMPVMDGLSAMRAIRQAEKSSGNRRVPMIALTADIMPETLSEVFRAGGDGLVPKPFKQKEFISMLDEWLPSGHQSPDEALNKHQSTNSIFDVKSDVIINESVLNELKVLLGNDFTLLIDAFFDDAQNIMVSFDKMLSKEDEADYALISRLAHSLKSVSQNVGAMTMSSMAAQLEQESRQGDAPDLKAKLQEILSMYQNVKNKLQGML